MSRERIEPTQQSHESPRRRLVCSRKEEKHIHSRVSCYQRTRRSRGRGRRRWLELQKLKRIHQERVGVGGLEIQSRSATLEFSERRGNCSEGYRVRGSVFESPGSSLDSLDARRRKGSRRFIRVLPHNPRVLPEPVKLPGEGDLPFEPVPLPVRRKAA